MNARKRKSLGAVLISMLILTGGCTARNTDSSSAATDSDDEISTGISSIDSAAAGATGFTPLTLDANAPDDIDADNTATIILSGSTADINGSGAKFENGNLLITEAGQYTLSGELTDGQVIVNTSSDSNVKLVLAGVKLHCSNTSAIYIQNADNAVISLAEGTENFVSDGEAYNFSSSEETEPDAAIFCHDNLTINGSGSLEVTGSYADAIASKDDFCVVSGSITATAKGKAIRGKDSVTVKGGTLNLTTSEGDALKSAAGYVNITGGSISCTSKTADCIQGETGVVISGGDISINSADDGISSVANIEISGGSISVTSVGKGIKSDAAQSYTGGTVKVVSTDDSIHSAGEVIISNGALTLSSEDDGVHSDSNLSITGGTVDILKSYEGLEGDNIYIKGGTHHIAASDDGLNAATASESSSDADNGFFGGGFGGKGGGMSQSGDNILTISGGYVFVNAEGDGVDSNGALNITGGTTIVFGPTGSGNGAMDSGSSFKISGGTLLAVGSSGMAESPTECENQSFVMLTSSVSKGTLCAVTQSDGTELIAFEALKNAQSVLYSSPAITEGESYSLYTGGTHSSTATDNVYAVKGYTPGTSATTSEGGKAGSFSGFGGGKGDFGGGRGGFGKRSDSDTSDGDFTPPEMSDGDFPNGDFMTPPEGEMPSDFGGSKREMPTNTGDGDFSTRSRRNEKNI